MKPTDTEKRICVRTVSYSLLFAGSCVWERESLTYLQDQRVNLQCLHLRFPVILSSQSQQPEVVIEETNDIGQCKHLTHTN